FSDSQYFVTFKRNKHNETIIDHVIDNDDMDEDLFVLEEQDGTTDSEYEPSSEMTHKRNRKNRVGGREKKSVSKRTNKGKKVESKKIPTLPELPMFEPMENLNELHKGYTTLPHEMEQGIIATTDTKITSKNFRIALVWSLIQEVLDNEINGNRRITRSQATKKNISLKSPPK
ncbi:42918_t:CDS:2, partial [Gigaspora margarita]